MFHGILIVAKPEGSSSDVTFMLSPFPSEVWFAFLGALILTTVLSWLTYVRN